MSTYKELKKELLKDPEVKREYEALEPKFKRIRRKIKERTNGKEKNDRLLII